MEKENGEVGQHTLVVRYYCPYTCRLPDAASLQERGCSELKLQATEVEVSGVKLCPELPPVTL